MLERLYSRQTSLNKHQTIFSACSVNMLSAFARGLKHWRVELILYKYRNFAKKKKEAVFLI